MQILAFLLSFLLFFFVFWFLHTSEISTMEFALKISSAKNLNFHRLPFSKDGKDLSTHIPLAFKPEKL